MKKILLPIIILLSACSTTKEIQYVDKPIPFYIVPAPPEIQKPQYPQYSKEELRSNPGLAVRVTVVTKQIDDEYINLLEEIINKYKELSEKSKQNLKDLDTVSEGMFGSSQVRIEQETESHNNDHLKDIILTEDFFNKIKEKSKENNEKYEKVE